MSRRIDVYLDDDVLHGLNEHTRRSPLSRSEIVSVAVRRFLRDERRRIGVPLSGTVLARRIAVGELPSRKVDGRRAAARGAPWSN